MKQLVIELASKNGVLKKFERFGVDIGRYMRHGRTEKMEIIKFVEQSNLPVKRTLQELNINRSTFYNWYRRYVESGYVGLTDCKSTPRKYWNNIPEPVKKQAVDIALN